MCVHVFTGLLGPVHWLKFNPGNQTLSWDPPFQFNTSETIVYGILVTKVTEQSHDSIIVKYNYTETSLDLSTTIEGDVIYNASVWALNVVGKGEETSLTFGDSTATTSEFDCAEK